MIWFAFIKEAHSCPMRRLELLVDEGSSVGGVLVGPVRDEGSFYCLAVVEGGEVWEDSRRNECVGLGVGWMGEGMTGVRDEFQIWGCIKWIGDGAILRRRIRFGEDHELGFGHTESLRRPL